MNNMNLNIEKDKIDITLSGSIVADVLNEFVWLFKNVVIGIV